jgi:hypothetical protein
MKRAARAGFAVPPGVAAVRLGELLEDRAQLLLRNADAGVLCFALDARLL